MEPSHVFDRATDADARERLRRCCGSTRWIDGMIARRPFHSREGLLAAARDVWFSLTPADWLEAFTHHPKIGDRQSLQRRFGTSGALSEKEQAGLHGVSADVLDALADANERYLAKFGYIFIVCATGRRAAEMLAMLRDRLDNDPETEIRIAAEEQAKITELRLAGALEPNQNPRTVEP
jgi:2-oxo-4-hydroxy-4-carboxy-5-ureidoimidazoline decarboxylase